jgi:hypothetical protein
MRDELPLLAGDEASLLELFDSMPPHDLNIERSVLGTLIVEWDAPDVAKGMRTRDFYDGRFRAFLDELHALRGEVTGSELIDFLLPACHVADLPVAALADAILKCEPARQGHNIRALRRLRVRRERIEAAVAILRVAYLRLQWDDESEARWLADAKTLLARLQQGTP